MKGKLDPSALSVEDTARVLKAAGAKHVTEEEIQADLSQGAPSNPDGTINLVHYAAWLVKGMGRGRA